MPGHYGKMKNGKMKKAKCSAQQIEEFTTEATQGDYDHLLQTCMEYFVTE